MREKKKKEEKEMWQNLVSGLSETSSTAPIRYWPTERPMSGWGGGLPVGLLHGAALNRPPDLSHGVYFMGKKGKRSLRLRKTARRHVWYLEVCLDAVSPGWDSWKAFRLLPQAPQAPPQPNISPHTALNIACVARAECMWTLCSDGHRMMTGSPDLRKDSTIHAQMGHMTGVTHVSNT